MYSDIEEETTNLLDGCRRDFIEVGESSLEVVHRGKVSGGYREVTAERFISKKSSEDKKSSGGSIWSIESEIIGCKLG